MPSTASDWNEFITWIHNQGMTLLTYKELDSMADSDSKTLDIANVNLMNKVQAITNDLTDTVRQELQGFINSNTARLRKGAYLVELEQLGEEIASDGKEALGGRTPLQWAVATVEDTFRQEGLLNVNADDYNARAVYKALRPYGGVQAEFEDVFAAKAIGADTGDLTRSVGYVPINKLFYMREYFDQDFNAAVSFAAMATEQELKKINKLVRQLDMPPQAALEAINEAGSGVDIDELVEAHITAAGQEPATKKEYRNISVTADLFHGMYERSVDMASLILGSLGRQLDDDNNRLNNTSFMELLLELFDPQDNGPWHLLELMHRLDVVDEKEVDAFRSLWDEAGLAERWADHVGSDNKFKFADVYGDTQAAEPAEDEDEEDPFDFEEVIDEIDDYDEMPF